MTALNTSVLSEIAITDDVRERIETISQAYARYDQWTEHNCTLVSELIETPSVEAAMLIVHQFDWLYKTVWTVLVTVLALLVIAGQFVVSTSVRLFEDGQEQVDVYLSECETTQDVLEQVTSDVVARATSSKDAFIDWFEAVINFDMQSLPGLFRKWAGHGKRYWFVKFCSK